MKQTEIGPIPDEWDVRPLLTVLRFATGQVSPLSEPYRSMILVAPDHVESGTGRLLQRRTAGEQGAISGKYLFRSGDIVYSKIRPYLNKAYLADFDGLCSADMYPLTPTSDVAPGYMLAVMLGKRFNDFVSTVSMRSGIPKVNRDELAQFRVALPPPREQRAIAAALNDAEALMSSLSRVIGRKRGMRDAVAHQLLAGEVRLPGFESEWRVTRLAEMFTAVATANNPRADLQTFGDIGYIHYGDIHAATSPVLDCAQTSLARIARAKVPTIPRLRDGDLVIADASEDYAGIGKAVEIRHLGRSEVVGGLHTIALRGDPTVIAEGFRSYLQFIPDVRAALSRRATGISVFGISKRGLLGIEMRLPPLDEQRAIAGVLSDMDAEIEALEARLAKTRDLKTAMAEELLAGRTLLT